MEHGKRPQPMIEPGTVTGRNWRDELGMPIDYEEWLR